MQESYKEHVGVRPRQKNEMVGFVRTPSLWREQVQTDVRCAQGGYEVKCPGLPETRKIKRLKGTDRSGSAAGRQQPAGTGTPRRGIRGGADVVFK